MYEDGVIYLFLNLQMEDELCGYNKSQACLLSL